MPAPPRQDQGYGRCGGGDGPRAARRQVGDGAQGAIADGGSQGQNADETKGRVHGGRLRITHCDASAEDFVERGAAALITAGDALPARAGRATTGAEERQ
eukprot:8870489-Pyramimonas_sp.AAC.1